MNYRVATLAVGTEVTDGQIIDRNSTILSQLAVNLGFEIIEHRAVPDDREMILKALRELGSKAEILFVTGGLGPTSDDFTRELIAKYATQPLEYVESAWQHVVKILSSRGVAAREIQRQQCYFPKGAKIYTNPAGTANAFSIDFNNVKIFALPGPPSEVHAIWKTSLQSELKSLVPISERQQLRIWRCLGRGESDIAEIVEPIVQKGQVKVGYRAHAPYIEVKVWTKSSDDKTSVFKEIDQALSAHLVNRDFEDVAKDFISRVSKFDKIFVQDFATRGVLAERLFSIIREESLKLDLSILTAEGSVAREEAAQSKPEGSVWLCLSADSQEQSWKLQLRAGDRSTEHIFKTIYNHKIDSERGRKYICERALQFASSELAKLE